MLARLTTWGTLLVAFLSAAAAAADGCTMVRSPDIVLSNRSLVYLRLGRFDRAMADDTASIALRRKSPRPLYTTRPWA